MSRFAPILVDNSLALFLPGDATAQIAEFDLDVVESPALEGRHFGEAGQYELLRGIVTGAVDPNDPRNQDIVNLDRAARNDAGRVEYRTTVEIYRPIDMTRWNRGIYHTVSNRGRSGPAEVALLERGFAFVPAFSTSQVKWLEATIRSSPPEPVQSHGQSVMLP